MPAIALVVCLLVACSTTIPRPKTPIRPNVERAVLEEIVSGENPPEDAVVFLVGEFLGERRLHEGREFFRALSRRRPDVPAFSGLDGFFSVLLAEEVSLLKRETYVRVALEQMDRAVAAQPRSPVRLFRAFVLAQLPERFDRGEQAVEELELLTSKQAGLQSAVLRDAYLALAQAYTRAGRQEDAQRALKTSGYASLTDNPLRLTTPIAVGPRAGTRYLPRELSVEGPGLYAAYGFDYGDLYFVATDDGIVAIDAGSTPDRMREVLAALRAHTGAPITHIILTHAHWDHAGGIVGLRGPQTRVVASARYRETLRAMAPINVDLQPTFLGDGGHVPADLDVDVEIAVPEVLVLGGVEFHLTPLEGAETVDSLLIEVPDRNALFVGDSVAAIGVPFVNEGSTEAYIRMLERLSHVDPDTRIYHGHQLVGELIDQRLFADLSSAFAQLRSAALADIAAGHGPGEILSRRGMVPALHSQPEITVPYLIFREQFLRRLFHEHVGAWWVNGDGLEVVSPQQLAKAVALLANGEPQRFAAASRDLLDRGDFVLAWKLADLGVRAHPESARLRALRRRALLRLIERNQRWDFFKLSVYAHFADVRIPPVPPAR